MSKLKWPSGGWRCLLKLYVHRFTCIQSKCSGNPLIVMEKRCQYTRRKGFHADLKSVLRKKRKWHVISWHGFCAESSQWSQWEAENQRQICIQSPPGPIGLAFKKSVPKLSWKSHSKNRIKSRVQSASKIHTILKPDSALKSSASENSSVHIP